MAVKDRMINLLDRIEQYSELIDSSSVEHLIKEVGMAKSIFVSGAGRSGYVAKAFAMRLMHLGFVVHVVGEATTPAISSKDLLIAVSGSGETYSVVGIAEAAKRKNAAVIAITSNPRSVLSKISDSIVQIKGRLPAVREKDYLARQVKGGHVTLAPMGTLFELSTMVFFDSLVEELMLIKRKNESYLKRRHTNLE
jgi:6-phospho-3-hexuloisomerase